jgi:hypothetical protein
MNERRCRSTVFALIAAFTSIIAAQQRAETLAAESAGQDASAPAISNFDNGEIIRYPAALLLGTLADKNETKIAIVNQSARKPSDRQWSGIAHYGRFKALVELQPGENRLELSAGKAKLSWVLRYRPQTNPYLVRMVYFTDKSGNTAYQTPVAGDSHDFRGKFDTALKLMQCFTAEDMKNGGYGRRTFNLEFDTDGRVIVHVVKGRRTAEEYWKTDDVQLYDIVARAIERQIPNPTAINLAVMAFTSFDPATKRNRAHTALGGGNLALFGGSTIYTWPNSVVDAQRACMDDTMPDTNRFASDSIGRNSYWANTSTCTGACLHELGHAFGLPHSADYNGIMVRGIDNFTRKFVFVDPPCVWKGHPVEFEDSEIGHWEPVSLAAMAPTRHFALDDRKWNDQNTIRCELSTKAGTLTIKSDDGLRFVGVDALGRADFFAPIDRNKPAPRQVVISLADVGRRVASKDAELRIVDAQGNMRGALIRDVAKQGTSPAVDSSELAALLAGPYVRTWHFSKVTFPWSGPPQFADVDAAKLKEIVDSALGRPAVAAADNFVDFAPQFPADKQQNVAGYAVRKIISDRPRKIRLLTGSDDALRIWLNGQIVQKVPLYRDAKPDSESCSVELPRGESVLVAEVSQADGGWGLYLRLQDAEGRDLSLADNGRVVQWTSDNTQRRPSPK